MKHAFTHFPEEKDLSRAEKALHSASREPKVLDAERLIRQAFRQDARLGYEQLFRQFYKPLCSHAVRYVYARDVAEDIVSDVFLNFWRGQAHLTVSTTFQAYLFGAVRNRVLNHLRNEALHEAVEAASPVGAEAAEDPQQILQFTELYVRIQTTITSLPPQCQRVFILSRFEGKTYAQIADQLDISVKTVETHLSKALTTLRRMLAEDAAITRR